MFRRQSVAAKRSEQLDQKIMTHPPKPCVIVITEAAAGVGRSTAQMFAATDGAPTSRWSADFSSPNGARPINPRGDVSACADQPLCVSPAGTFTHFRESK
jgi:hypothetical protein